MGDLLGQNFLLAMAFLIFSSLTTSTPLMDTCPPPRLLNGRVRFRFGGHIAKFNCNQGYRIWGAKYATCVQGKWDTDPPKCIRRGCHPMPNIYKGKIMVSFDGALATLFCEKGYYLKLDGKGYPGRGYTSVYCNGRNWNVTSYYCVASQTTTITSTSTTTAVISSSIEPSTPPPTQQNPTPPPPSTPPSQEEVPSTPVPTPFPTSLPPPTPPPAPPYPPSQAPSLKPSSSLAPPSSGGAAAAPSASPDLYPPPTWCDFDGSDAGSLLSSSGTSSWLRNSRGRLEKVGDSSGLLCGWTVNPSPELNWSRQSIIGPLNDNAPSKRPQGGYMLAQNTALGEGEASLQSPAFDAGLSGTKDSPACFSFSYWIKNGVLLVSLNSNGSTSSMWSQKNNTAGTWTKGWVGLKPQSAPFTISLIGNFSKGSLGSIAVDNLSLTSGQGCPSSASGTGSSDWQTSVGNGTYLSLSTAAQTPRYNATASPSTSAPPPSPSPPAGSSKAPPTSASPRPSSTSKAANQRPPSTTAKDKPSKTDQEVTKATAATSKPSSASPPLRKPTTAAWIPYQRVTKATKGTTAGTFILKTVSVPSRVTAATTPIKKSTAAVVSSAASRTAVSKAQKTTITPPSMAGSSDGGHRRSKNESDEVAVLGYRGEVRGREPPETVAPPAAALSASVVWGSSVASLVILGVAAGFCARSIRTRRRRAREGGDGDSEVRYLTSEEEQLDFSLQKVACEDM